MPRFSEVAHELGQNEDVLEAFLRNVFELGLPALGLSVRRTFGVPAWLQDNVIVELFSDGFIGEFDETRTLTRPGRTGPPITENRTVREISLRNPGVLRAAIEHTISIVGADASLNRAHWYRGSALWTHDLPWAYAVDANCLWPTFTVLGTGHEVEDDPAFTSASSKGDELVLRQLGYPAIGFDLAPSFSFRIRQDLIRIKDNEIRWFEGGTRERLMVTFAVGALGSMYVQANEPSLSVMIVDKVGATLLDTTFRLSADMLRTGLFVPGAETFASGAIYRARIEVRLGNTVVDYSDGHYLRSIHVSARVSDGAP